MKILITDPIDESAIEKLREFSEVFTRYGLEKSKIIEEIQEVDVLVVRSKTIVDKEIIDAGKNLKAIVRAGVGLDNIDVNYAREKGVKVLNTPEAPRESVAELAIGLMLSLARHITKADSSVKEGKWLKKELYGSELMDKILGIIGFGRIGSRVAKIARGFGMNILVYDTFAKEKYLEEVNAKRVELSDLLENSDFVSIHVPLTEKTRGMIGKNEFSKMKKTAYLINTARGPVVEEEALYNALKNEKIAGAGLDVYWEKTPFSSKIMEVKDRIVFTPHLGSSTKEAQKRIGKLLIEKIKELN